MAPGRALNTPRIAACDSNRRSSSPPRPWPRCARRSPPTTSRPPSRACRASGSRARRASPPTGRRSRSSRTSAGCRRSGRSRRGRLPAHGHVLRRPVGGVEWSPDGQWIAFSLAPGGGMNAQVFLVKPDGTGLKQPDGRRARRRTASAASGTTARSSRSARTGGPASRIDAYLYDAEAGRLTLVSEIAGTGGFEDLSRDGKRALLNRLRYRGSNDLFLVDLATKKETLLTPHEGPGSYNGVFSPDGDGRLGFFEWRTRPARLRADRARRGRQARARSRSSRRARTRSCSRSRSTTRATRPLSSGTSRADTNCRLKIFLEGNAVATAEAARRPRLGCDVVPRRQAPRHDRVERDRAGRHLPIRRNLLLSSSSSASPASPTARIPASTSRRSCPPSS